MWTTEMLETLWVGESIQALGDRSSTAIEAFNCVEKHLGAAWLEARRLKATGPMPTHNLVFLGECLQATELLDGFDVLLAKVRVDDVSVLSELEAVKLFVAMGGVEIGLAPELPVGNAIKRPDFRVRRLGERWTYVEVTRPDMSVASVAAQDLLQRFLVVTQVSRSFSMEFFLRSEPTSVEEGQLLAAATQLADSDRFGVMDFPGLALITKQPFTGGTVVVVDHPAEDNTVPRYGAANGIFGGDGTEPQRLVSVRVPFFDSRADAFLTTEAKQLSKEEQGLIMMDMAVVRAGIKNWLPLLQRRLQPNLHTRVGAICLFAHSGELCKEGMQLLSDIAVIENPHASLALPPWIAEGLDKVALADDAKRLVPRRRQPTGSPHGSQGQSRH
jgi:hypothetical protein